MRAKAHSLGYIQLAELALIKTKTTNNQHEILHTQQINTYSTLVVCLVCGHENHFILTFVSVLVYVGYRIAICMHA